MYKKRICPCRFKHSIFYSDFFSLDLPKSQRGSAEEWKSNQGLATSGSRATGCQPLAYGDVAKTHLLTITAYSIQRSRVAGALRRQEDPEQVVSSPQRRQPLVFTSKGNFKTLNPTKPHTEKPTGNQTQEPTCSPLCRPLPNPIKL